eukprot:CAMPEP_0181370162 /NCGR_PEP_ID=MMETSP1106-20121128/13250_1 /TAXON_ID=81844 /ORGANISM="Mantoniella antarctica, Strain SL-175" /LENGTH=79 /DNA_ID=CAMNT_0023486879 /DNA_START=128 /DNA_END=367 /DNA_ORIENTATION=+
MPAADENSAAPPWPLPPPPQSMLCVPFDQLLGSKDRSGLSRMRDGLEATRAASSMVNVASWKPGRYVAEKHDLTQRFKP